MNNKVILAVDDERSNIEVLANILGDTYDLRVASRGDKALESIKKFQVDLILLDIQMPGMDGFEVAEIILQDPLYKDIPIIFLTSSRDEGSIVRGFKMGAVDYITKPFNREELRVRVENHLQLSELKLFFQSLLDSLSSIVVLTNGQDVFYGNQSLLNFFQFDSLAEFKSKYSRLDKLFLKDENQFFCDPNNPESWIAQLLRLESHQRTVAMSSKHNQAKHIFRVNLKQMPLSHLYLAEFIDISHDFHAQRILLDKTLHDPLTGAFNREFFDKNIDSILAHNQTNKLQSAVGFMDIDLFKNVNDKYGHDVGDATLKKIVMTIKKEMRNSDVLLRWGGEEFLLIISLASEADLARILEKFRSLIDLQIFADVGHVTCSFGASIHCPNESIHDTIKRSDQALYQSKHRGRNCVTIV
ncbi:hypothetical protein THMIRHAS_09650 [Thiosulfatimonas sediminis]|uniref:diguanylate cyclase n=1 Tax=Thiosulfatimonas sediminis TaxID=2675054 RepID=A0A6F8PTX8_9GAMM|nr:diguanylate cyclase [Thiosulfatimonas sediminis]BBP45592.1 hypothetical protein THMIRHAS_09650 [Thiosulfatimonas sediminis]